MRPTLCNGLPVLIGLNMQPINPKYICVLLFCSLFFSFLVLVYLVLALGFGGFFSILYIFEMILGVEGFPECFVVVCYLYNLTVIYF